MLGRFLFVIIAVTSFVIDRVLKLIIQREIEVGDYVSVIDGVLELRHVHNPGIAFGMFAGAGGIVVIGSLIVGALLFTFLLRVEPSDLLTITGGGLITGGALGNLVDRVQYGYVIDYINLPRWPTFNAADIAITSGVACILVAQLLAIRDEHRASKDTPE